MVALIPARGGSRGLPNKNLRPLGGTPLIAHSIRCAQASAGITRVIVSTDNPAIADLARAHGAEAPFLRPAALAGDETPMLPVLQHAVSELERSGPRLEAIVLLQPTSPLRSVEDVEACLALFRGGDCDAVISVSPVHKSPYRNMVIEHDGYLRLLLSPERPLGRRQDEPPVYDINGAVYVFSRAALMDEQSTLPRRSKLWLMPHERSIDIDSAFDLALAEFVLSQPAAGAVNGAT